MRKDFIGRAIAWRPMLVHRKWVLGWDKNKSEKGKGKLSSVVSLWRQSSVSTWKWCWQVMKMMMMMIFVWHFLPRAICFPVGLFKLLTAWFLLMRLLALIDYANCVHSILFFCSVPVCMYFWIIFTSCGCYLPSFALCLCFSIQTNPREEEIKESKGRKGNLPPVVFDFHEKSDKKNIRVLQVQCHETNTTWTAAWESKGLPEPQRCRKEPAPKLWGKASGLQPVGLWQC